MERLAGTAAGVPPADSLGNASPDHPIPSPLPFCLGRAGVGLLGPLCAVEPSRNPASSGHDVESTIACAIEHDLGEVERRRARNGSANQLAILHGQFNNPALAGVVIQERCEHFILHRERAGRADGLSSSGGGAARTRVIGRHLEIGGELGEFTMCAEPLEAVHTGVEVEAVGTRSHERGDDAQGVGIELGHESDHSELAWLARALAFRRHPVSLDATTGQAL